MIVRRYDKTRSSLADLEPHYSAHIAAMTTENLHSKTDIAAELAWRDKVIEKALTLLVPCRTCHKPATRGYPTAEIGYFVYGCDEHRQGPEAFDMKQSAFVRALLGA
jgi:hypothetical protein